MCLCKRTQTGLASFLAEQFIETSVAIWLVVILLECACGKRKDGFMDTRKSEDFLTFIKLLQAKCTNKVFGVEFPEL